MSDEYIDVVAGIIYNPTKDQVLLSLRKPTQHQGNRWEFPGGKVEATESIEQALHRELVEELDIRTKQVAAFCQIEHRYPDKSVRLHFWQVDDFDGTPVGKENQQLRWFNIAELVTLDFPQANQPVVDRLLAATSAV